MTHQWVEIRQRVYQCSRCGRVIAVPRGTAPRWDALGQCTPEQKSGPPVWNYARAVLRWTAAGCPLRPPEEQERIFAICQACPHYNAERVACSVCGCFLRRGSILFSKIAWQTEHCPLEKW